MIEIIDQRLNDKKSLLVAPLVAVMEALVKNPYGVNLLNSPYSDIDGKGLLEFAELCCENRNHYYIEVPTERTQFEQNSVSGFKIVRRFQ